MSGRVSVPCWHVTFVANAPWKPLINRWSSVSRSYKRWKVWFIGNSLLVCKGQNVIYHSREGDTYFILLNKIPVSTIKFKHCTRLHEYILNNISYAPHILVLITEANWSQVIRFSFWFIWHWSHKKNLKRKWFCYIPLFSQFPGTWIGGTKQKS